MNIFVEREWKWCCVSLNTQPSASWFQVCSRGVQNLMERVDRKTRSLDGITNPVEWPTEIAMTPQHVFQKF